MFTNENINFKDYVQYDENLLLSDVRTDEEIFDDTNNEKG